MTSILKVDEVQDSSGNLIIKEVANAITIGASGDTITIPSGATITNNGTQTGFGGANTPYFYAYKSANSSLSDATWTVVVFDTEKQDSASAYNTSTGIFTVPSGQAGKYYLEHGVRVEASTSQVDRMFCYGESGGGSTQYWGNGSMDFRGNPGQGTTVYGSGIITLAESDTAKVNIYCDVNAGTPTLMGNAYLTTWFLGYKIIE